MTSPVLPNPFAEMSAAWSAVAEIVAVEDEIPPAPMAYLQYDRRYYAGQWFYRTAPDATWQRCEHDPDILAVKLESAVAGALKGRLTRLQVQWASTHDWFVADLGSGLIQIVDRWWNVKTGEKGADVLVWDKSFSELRDWAGY